jgi:hypothetical protein
MTSARAYSNVSVKPGTHEFIQIVDVLKNYTEWFYKSGEVPETVAAMFVVSLCPKLSYPKVLRMFFYFCEESEEDDNIIVEDFVEIYIRTNDIVKEEYSGIWN